MKKFFDSAQQALSDAGDYEEVGVHFLNKVGSGGRGYASVALRVYYVVLDGTTGVLFECSDVAGNKSALEELYEHELPAFIQAVGITFDLALCVGGDLSRQQKLFLLRTAVESTTKHFAEKLAETSGEAN